MHPFVTSWRTATCLSEEENVECGQVPDDSYAFFSDYFDLGSSMTNGKFNTFEIDFLDMNFKGCADCFADVTAASKW